MNIAFPFLTGAPFPNTRGYWLFLAALVCIALNSIVVIFIYQNISYVGFLVLAGLLTLYIYKTPKDILAYTSYVCLVSFSFHASLFENPFSASILAFLCLFLTAVTRNAFTHILAPAHSNIIPILEAYHLLALKCEDINLCIDPNDCVIKISADKISHDTLEILPSLVAHIQSYNSWRNWPSTWMQERVTTKRFSSQMDGQGWSFETARFICLKKPKSTAHSLLAAHKALQDPRAKFKATPHYRQA